MSLYLCSSSSELTCQCTKTRCLARLDLPPFNHGVKIKCADGNENIKVSNGGTRKLSLSSHLIPGHVDGSFMVKKRTKEPTQKLEFVRTLLIDNYDSYTYNIYQELSLINGVPPLVVRNDDWTWEDLCHFLYDEKAFDNIVISPGPGSPTCPDDIGICLRVLLECKDIPILGVCLGHQALGYVHGAKVVHAPEPIHGRLSEIKHNGCKLFNGIPSGRNSGFKVVRYHSLIIDSESLPKEIIPISWTSSTEVLPYFMSRKSPVTIVTESQMRMGGSGDDLFKQLENSNSWPFSPSKLRENRNILMGIMHSTRPHYGVQFHPESVGTLHGRQIFQNFRKITEEYWMSFRQSVTNNGNVHYAAASSSGLYHAACMQASDASRLVNEVPRCVTVMDGADKKLCMEVFRERNAERKADKSDWFRLLNMATLSHASNVKFLKLRWRKFDSIASQLGGARKIFCELYGHQHAEDTFWLDSSSTEKGRARFSFMGGKGGSLWKQMTFRLSHKSDLSSKGGGYLTVEDAKGSTQTTFLEDGFLNFLDKELESFRYEKEDFEGLPFDFQGGYIGYLGYGLKVECSNSINHHKSKTPDACFFFADNLLVIDHLNDDVYIMSLHDNCTTMTPWLDDTEQKLLGLKAPTMNKVREPTLRDTGFYRSKMGFLADKTREQYMSDVKKCQEYIRDGESYELCLTTQIRKTIGEIDSLRLYLQLRDRNPAPYASWLNFWKENLCICCSSPERFLRLDRDGVLEAKPIKGTVARGTTIEEDERLKLQLQLSEKDQAENLMIVDLLRNDLGRVCEPGSVHVPHLMDVESYATVHTMVSTIRGKKRSNISPIDCVKAAFPGGSMTGAPKLRSMEILDSIESCPRGIYSGCIGYFSYNKTFDLNIVIRTVVLHEGEASIGAGGAIVALSNPADEYEEMSLKTGAPAMAVMEFS